MSKEKRNIPVKSTYVHNEPKANQRNVQSINLGKSLCAEVNSVFYLNEPLLRQFQRKNSKVIFPKRVKGSSCFFLFFFHQAVPTWKGWVIYFRVFRKWIHLMSERLVLLCIFHYYLRSTEGAAAPWHEGKNLSHKETQKRNIKIMYRQYK